MTLPLRRGIQGTIVAVIVTALTLGSSVASTTAAQAEVGSEYQSVQGSGSSWSANALDQWIRNVFANYRWTVSYTNNGSTAGRTLFSQGSMDFGVSEIPYALSGSDAPDPRPKRQFAYIPIVAGGTSFMYNLAIGGQRVTNLRLSGDTLAKIFTGVITKWNDPAVAKDNPKLTLPAITVVPVVRSDGSGTTAQFSAWMRSQHPDIWNAYCAKAGRSNCGITSNYPVVPGSAFVSQQGSDGVAGFVKGDAAGAITYVETSYALNEGFPVAKVLNSAGYYTEPTASNVAVSLLAAVINSDETSVDYLTANLGGVYGNGDPRTYPLSSYSYMIVPTAVEGNFSLNKGRTLADFVSYFLCEGQQQAEVLGYSPLPVNLASAGLEQAQKIPGGDPQNKTIASCNNPTFSPDGTNKLANEAPQPQACDKQGADQCLTGTGGAAGTVTADSSSSASGGGSAAAGGTGAAGAAGAGGAAGAVGSGGAPTAVDGKAVGLTAGGDPIVAGSPIDLPGRDLSLRTLAFMLLAAMAAIALVVLPPIVARRRAAMVGIPRGPTKRRPAGQMQFQKPSRNRLGIPKVHLGVPFRKRGSAAASKGDS
ncbi:phosphate transport system substrate-binding protein [Salinibacterium sp. CAN_S4]|uniref:phosphate ABC transporter substrate-binding protein PstS n=1 Tax=Salinibacterium sp. CAN_S4 TaxID=2787727 RepID=UPI001A197AB6